MADKNIETKENNEMKTDVKASFNLHLSKYAKKRRAI